MGTGWVNPSATDSFQRRLGVGIIGDHLTGAAIRIMLIIIITPTTPLSPQYHTDPRQRQQESLGGNITAILPQTLLTNFVDSQIAAQSFGSRADVLV